MSNREKLVAWGRDRLERHEQDMDGFLAHLYAERAQNPHPESDQELVGLIQAIEAQRAETEHTRHRLTPKRETVATASLPAREADDSGPSQAA